MPRDFWKKVYAGIEELHKDPEKAFQLLVDAGIYTKDGQLTEHFRQ